MVLLFKPFGIVLYFNASFSSFLRKKGTVWGWLSSGVVCLKQIIHHNVVEESWLIFTSTLLNSVLKHTVNELYIVSSSSRCEFRKKF